MEELLKIIKQHSEEIPDSLWQIKIRKAGCLYGNDTSSRRVYQARHGMCPSLMSRDYKDPVKIIVNERILKD